MFPRPVVSPSSGLVCGGASEYQNTFNVQDHRILYRILQKYICMQNHYFKQNLLKTISLLACM
jgi:hypothetical protein